MLNYNYSYMKYVSYCFYSDIQKTQKDGKVPDFEENRRLALKCKRSYDKEKLSQGATVNV